MTGSLSVVATRQFLAVRATMLSRSKQAALTWWRATTTTHWSSTVKTARAGDDILIAGSVTYADQKYARHEAALAAIMREWCSPHAYEVRVNNLRGENPDLATFVLRENENFFLTPSSDAPTVFDDFERDLLTGSAGLDWFMFSDTEDKVTDLSDKEFADILDFIMAEASAVASSRGARFVGRIVLFGLRRGVGRPIPAGRVVPLTADHPLETSPPISWTPSGGMLDRVTFSVVPSCSLKNASGCANGAGVAAKINHDMPMPGARRSNR